MTALTRTKGPTTHFLDTIDLSNQEMLDLFETIRMLKEADMQGAVPQILKGASLAMIFEEPSTRTRVSFETAMTDLGGHALYLKPGEIHFGSHEAIKDTARVISSMCHGIMLRAKEHESVMALAEHATVPVFNAMTYYNHPTQGVCDFFTMSEYLPEGKKLEDIHVVFVGDSREDTGIMSKETGHMCATLGLRYTVCSPTARWKSRAKCSTTPRARWCSRRRRTACTPSVACWPGICTRVCARRTRRSSCTTKVASAASWTRV